MNAVAITEKLLLKAGGWEAMKPAREVLKAGRVAEAKYEPPLLTGAVREGARTYHSGLRVKSAVDVENLCTCQQSRSWGTICAHSVAVGLAHLTPPPPPADQATQERGEATAPPGPEFVTGDSKTVAVHIILPPNFASAWQRGQIMVVAEAEENGRRTLISTLPQNSSYTCDESDFRAVEALRDFPALFASGMVTLARAEFLRVLAALRSHPRVTFGKATHAAIANTGTRLMLSLDSARDGGLRAGIEVPPDATVLAAGSEAWLLLRNEFTAIGSELPEIARTLLERPVSFEQDRALRFIAFDLPKLRHFFEVRADQQLAMPEVAVATPRFILRVAGSLNAISAELLCSYAGRAALPAGSDEADQFVFRDPQNATLIFTRNLMSEKSAIRRLEQIGFARSADGNSIVLGSQTAVMRFFASEIPKLQRDWEVTLSPQVQKWSSELERVTPTLEIVGSGEDWFELRYSLATSGGEEFSSADMQRLLRSVQTQTRLRNGRVAVIDPEALDDFEQVIRDCDPFQTQPGTYRINRAQAGFVEATAHESGAVVQDRREALKNFIGNADARPTAELEHKLGSLTTILRQYQLNGVAWLTRLAANKFGGILADEMGLGKTVQTLAFLRAHQGHGPALIVCPTSLVANWQSEARKFTPELKTLLLEGPDRATLFGSITNFDIVITSYALLRRDIDELRKFQFSTAVLDEAQHIKNPETQNAQASYALRATHRFVLTGTPMENSVRDLWSIMNFAAPGYLGSRNDFRERYEQPLARGVAPGVQRRLSRRLQPFLLRRRKLDVAKDLPEKIEQVVPCSLTGVQRAAYDALLHEIQQGLGSSRKDTNGGAQRMKMLTGLLRLRQVCCDLRLVGIDQQDTSAKLDLLDELLGEAIDGEHRVLVFSQFVSMLHLIRERLEKREIPFCYLDGSTKQRQEVVNRFQSDAAIPVFLISLKAGGVGLNLSAADTVIHFDPWWNPAVEAQATDRAHRIGQMRVVTAYKLITVDTVEEKIVRLQEKKRAAIDAAIDSEEPLMNGLTTDELEELLA